MQCVKDCESGDVAAVFDTLYNDLNSCRVHVRWLKKSIQLSDKDIDKRKFIDRRYNLCS